MTKFQWEQQLSKYLSELPKHEVQRILEYYNELFQDKFENGEREESIISSFGEPGGVALEILRSYDSGVAFSRPPSFSSGGVLPQYPKPESGSPRMANGNYTQGQSANGGYGQVNNTGNVQPRNNYTQGQSANGGYGQVNNTGNVQPRNNYTQGQSANGGYGQVNNTGNVQPRNNYKQGQNANGGYGQVNNTGNVQPHNNYTQEQGANGDYGQPRSKWCPARRKAGVLSAIVYVFLFITVGIPLFVFVFSLWITAISIVVSLGVCAIVGILGAIVAIFVGSPMPQKLAAVGMCLAVGGIGAALLPVSIKAVKVLTKAFTKAITTLCRLFIANGR